MIKKNVKRRLAHSHMLAIVIGQNIALNESDYAGTHERVIVLTIEARKTNFKVQET